MKKGTALLLTLLTIAVIGTITFGVGKLALSETRIVTRGSGGVVAYYAAEAGIEDGLARWRWNRDVEVDSWIYDLKDDKEVRKVENINPQNPTYELKIGYKKDKIEGQLKKDESKEINIEGLSSLTLSYFGVQNARGTATVSMEVIAYNKSNMTPATVNGDSRGKLLTKTTQRNITISLSGNLANNYILRIKPWIGSNSLGTDENGQSGYASGPAPAASDPNLGLYIPYKIDPGPNQKIDSGVTTIESTGYFQNSKRKLVVEIDRQSGTILNVFDFVLFGQELKQ